MPFISLGTQTLNYEFARFPINGLMAALGGELMFRVSSTTPLIVPVSIDYQYHWHIDDGVFPDSKIHFLRLHDSVLFNLEAPPYLKATNQVLYDTYFRLNPLSPSPCTFLLEFFQ